MRKSKLLAGVSAMVLALTACSNDDDLPDNHSTNVVVVDDADANAVEDSKEVNRSDKR